MSEFFKEIGKYFLDISKIVFLVGVITPFFKEEKISQTGIVMAIILFFIGCFIIYKGANDGST